MEDQNGSGKLSQGLRKVKPYLAILSLQFGYSGMYIITMVSFKHGMSHWILSVYRHVVAAIIIVPFALVLERYISLSHFLFQCLHHMCVSLCPPTQLAAAFVVHTNCQCPYIFFSEK